MGKDKSKEIDFSRDVEHLMAGSEIQDKETMDAEYQANLAIAEKLMEYRVEPSAAFSNSLKNRLISDLQAREAVEKETGGWLKDVWHWLIKPESAWRPVAVTSFVILLIAVAVWSLGGFEPFTGGPVIVSPPDNGVPGIMGEPVPTTPPHDTQAPFNWPLTGGIITTILMLGFLMFCLVQARQKGRN